MDAAQIAGSEGTQRRPGAVHARPRDPGLRAAVVEVRRGQGAGRPRALRHVRDAVLPGAQHPDRQRRALEFDPMLVKRLRRMRATRQRARSARRLGIRL